MAIYARALPGCDQCSAPAAYTLNRSGTDVRGYACKRHVRQLGKALALRLGEEFAS